MKGYILIHYSEIGLKKANKPYFVKKLQNFIKIKLVERFKRDFRITHSIGRILVDVPEEFTGKDEKEYTEVLQKISGIKNFKFVFAGSTDLEKLGEQIWEFFPNHLFETENAPKTFRVKVKRSMILPYKSYEAEREIGAILLRKGLNLKAKMKNPDLTVDIEFLNHHGMFTFWKYEGPAGFPPNSQGKLIALMSSGIDSPVAAYRMMRRGARIIFAHFHGYPYTDQDEMQQVKDLVKILSDYQLDTKLYLIPFGQFQRSIATTLEIPGKVRTILYRRMMLRIAEKIAFKESANGLVTGDMLGQVASQTPENIFAIHNASSIPVFQPLISFDKEDVISEARKIGTLKISELPCKDTCTMFAPKKPELRAKVSDLIEYEKMLPINEWIEQAWKEAEISMVN